jgi:hypothetical protein
MLWLGAACTANPSWDDPPTWEVSYIDEWVIDTSRPNRFRDFVRIRALTPSTGEIRVVRIINSRGTGVTVEDTPDVPVLAGGQPWGRLSAPAAEVLAMDEMEWSGSVIRFSINDSLADGSYTPIGFVLSDGTIQFEIWVVVYAASEHIGPPHPISGTSTRVREIP